MPIPAVSPLDEMEKQDFHSNLRALGHWRPTNSGFKEWSILSLMGILLGILCPSIPIILDGWIFHEGGHAVAGWMSGLLSIPTPFFTAQWRVPYLSLFMVLLCAGGGYQFIRRNYLCLGSILWAATPFVLLFSCLSSEATAHQFIILSGLGGEIVLPLTSMLLFFAKFPVHTRWASYRWFFAGLGAYTLGQSWERWYAVRQGQRALPMGAAIDFGLLDGGESSGDMDRMIREFHWSSASISALYEVLSVASCLALCCFWVYLFYLLQRSQRVPNPKTSGPANTKAG